MSDLGDMVDELEKSACQHGVVVGRCAACGEQRAVNLESYANKLRTELTRLQSENERMSSELDAVRQDAESKRLNDARYRWLRENGNLCLNIGGVAQAECEENVFVLSLVAKPVALDAAIDARMQETKS